MKARLLALAAFLAAAAGGTVYFVNWSDGTEAPLPSSFGAFEVVDRSRCSVSACGGPSCLQANDILLDAGSACTTRLIECPVRFGDRARAQAEDAGAIFSAAKYQQVRLIALRCAATDGGFALGIPVDDAGWPVFATVAAPYPCAWKPDAGASCWLVDGGDPGVENTLQPGQFTGADCRPKSCVEIAGESSAP